MFLSGVTMVHLIKRYELMQHGSKVSGILVHRVGVREGYCCMGAKIFPSEKPNYIKANHGSLSVHLCSSFEQAIEKIITIPTSKFTLKPKVNQQL